MNTAIARWRLSLYILCYKEIGLVLSHHLAVLDGLDAYRLPTCGRGYCCVKVTASPIIVELGKDVTRFAGWTVIELDVDRTADTVGYADRISNKIDTPLPTVYPDVYTHCARIRNRLDMGHDGAV
jgi:hypothetical protein